MEVGGYVTALIGFVAFAFLAAINYRIGRSWLYPAAAMSGVWAMLFAALLATASFLYKISWQALAIYVVGCMFYSLGSYMMIIRGKTKRPFISGSYNSDYWLLVLLSLILVVGLPFYLYHLISLTNAMPFTPSFFLRLRQVNLQHSWSGERAPLIDNLVVLSTISAYVAMYVSDGRRKWKVLLIVIIGLSFIYNLLTGAKVGFANLAVGLLVIYLLKNRRLTIRFLVSVSVVFTLGFAWLTVARVEAASGGFLDFFSTLGLTAKTLLVYLAVSPVGFSVYLSNPANIPVDRSIWFFFERTANYFGNFFTIPTQHNPFVNVGPNLEYNTFTAYFTYYPDYGVVGVAVIMLFIGVVSTLVYRSAKRGAFLPVLVYAYLFYGSCMIFFNESLFLGLNFLVKIIFIGALFSLARKIRMDNIKKVVLHTP